MTSAQVRSDGTSDPCLTPRLTSNDRVGTSDGGNDVLDDPLRQAPSDTFDPVLLGTVGCLLIQPLDVVRVVVIELFV
jgi:hypothetical protein